MPIPRRGFVFELLRFDPCQMRPLCTEIPPRLRPFMLSIFNSFGLIPSRSAAECNKLKASFWKNILAEPILPFPHLQRHQLWLIIHTQQLTYVNQPHTPTDLVLRPYHQEQPTQLQRQME